jgi:signal transduction histidine kinase/CheY-like chemotaxis protein
VTETPQIEGRAVKILVVDDEDIVLSLVRDALEDGGYLIELASSGITALEKAEHEYFDFILTDIRMPECDGIELVKKIRELIPAIGVIFMTGYANLNSAKDAIKEGAYDYIMKPFELNEIRQAVRNAVRKKQKDTEKTLTNELNRLSDLNQLMYTVGDRKSLMRLSLGFALMQGKAQKGSVVFKGRAENEIGIISSGKACENQFEESSEICERDYFAFDSELFNAPFIIGKLEEHPCFKEFKDPRTASFLIPPWCHPGDRLVNIALRRGSNLYGFLILGFSEDTEMLQGSDLKLLSITANQIAISLENIVLLEQTRSAYSRLRDLQEQTIQLEKMAVKGQMSAEIGHELNNFLGVVTGNLSLLEHHLNQGNYQELEKYINAVKSNLDNIKKFTEGLMDFSSMASKFEPCDITALVGDVADYLQVQRNFQNILIELEKPEQPVFTIADTGQIHQLLFNLLNNAAEAIREKSGEASGIVKLILSFDSENEAYSITVADNGAGIDPNLLEKAFKQSFTTKPDGHGFGLLVCRRIIDNHKAKLFIDSTVGEGTTISVHFPILTPQLRPETVTS